MLSETHHYSILVNSSSRTSGTAWQYSVIFPSALYDISRASIRWVQFYDATSHQPVEVFSMVSAPYLSMVVNPFQGAHSYSTDARSRDALAVLHANYQVGTSHIDVIYDIPRLERVYRIDIAFYDDTETLVTQPNIENAFLLDLISSGRMSS